MRRWLLLVIVACGLTACASDPTNPTSTANSLLNVDQQRQSTIMPTPEWLDKQVDDVSVNLWRPVGWTVDSHSSRLTLLQHSPSIAQTSRSPENGVIVHFFSAPLERFIEDDQSLIAMNAQGENRALELLTRAIDNPREVGSAWVSQPQPFEWADHDAAYYLAAHGDEVRTLVMGIFLPEREKILVINVSIPMDQVEVFREMLPALFTDFTVDGVRFGGQALNALPAQLQFPT
jgi:hypothetical protein